MCMQNPKNRRKGQRKRTEAFMVCKKAGKTVRIQPTRAKVPKRCMHQHGRQPPTVCTAKPPVDEMAVSVPEHTKELVLGYEVHTRTRR